MSFFVSINDSKYEIEFDKCVEFNPALNLINYYESALKNNKSWVSYEQMINDFLNSVACVQFKKKDLFSYSVDFKSLGCISFIFRFNENCANPFAVHKYRFQGLPDISLITATCNVLFENTFNEFLFNKYKDSLSCVYEDF